MTDQPPAPPPGAGSVPDPARDAGHSDPPPRVGFFTDTTVCIGCKACEVACKEWNLLPEDGLSLSGMSYDNTEQLGASTWRHVAFIEQTAPVPPAPAGLAGPAGPLAPAAPPAPDGRVELPLAEAAGPAGVAAPEGADGPGGVRWLMSSDVCRHCTHAGCLDVCPTGALFRTEFGTVVVQEDVCNGCGYCVPACPYGVIEQRPGDGRAFKCTLCYDRLGAGQEPACAKACPTESIQYGPLDELRDRAAARLDQLHEAGVTDARLYGHETDDGVGGNGAFFLLLDEPEVYGMPPDPVVPTRHLPAMWRHAAGAGLALTGAVLAVFAAAGRRSGAGAPRRKGRT